MYGATMNDNVRKVTRLHREAMKFTDKSIVARLEGDRGNYLHYTRLAFEKEAAAADLMVDEIEIEPSRSVLHRSAATLAWRCEKYFKAKKLIYRALAGNPPPEIEWELNDLLGNVNLALAGISLSNRRIRLTLDGKDIANGRAPAKEIARRITSIESMLKITANLPIPLYYDAVGAGSFYVDLAVSKESQSVLPGFDDFDEIVEPLMQNLDLLNRGETQSLMKSIAHPAQYKQFVNAASKFAPDGNGISSVNLQALIVGEARSVNFTKSQDELSEIPTPEISNEGGEYIATNETIKKIGILQRADGSENNITNPMTECELKTETEGTWVIEVSEAIIHEVLGNYWQKLVAVKGKRMRKKRSTRRILLEHIANVIEITQKPEQSSTIF